ncbi:MAG: phosphoribosylglycinamide formyltransferase [Acutalibacteraceae bacterium]
MSKKVRIAVLVSGGGTNLKALIDAQNSGIIKSGEIVLVISSKAGAYALRRAEAAGIATAVCEKGGRQQSLFEQDILSELKSADAELIILAGFMNILSADFVKHYPDRIINVHPSLIPSFCGSGFYGLRVHKAALEYGVKVTGATVHFVNEIPDGGRIIMQKAVEVDPEDTPETLQRRVMENAEWIILPAAAEAVCKEIGDNK